jgi:hypothetical protein
MSATITPPTNRMVAAAASIFDDLQLGFMDIRPTIPAALSSFKQICFF